ncbi:PDR/VanB family oxidoreductase [Paenalcaligenes niemegkensis]|uniref:PDR/VanB family oxidoreductase n=1 Tax=Paenalcaligenes niemegkensis TaxID=2895469 RepID=UPI001EE8DDB4|nr:PDR/VanB family oxidoreductase [Paenalcaligenes niemegkensis]MCQ9615723.1 PDR/VanB family oxidoreductase [Paenalcaligenes niemegkensis]
METVTMEPAAIAQAKGLLSVSVRTIKVLANGIKSYELVAEGLPPFSAGSHIDVHIQEDLIRQYSLCNDPHEKNRYVIAILREVNGRGGSQYIHDQITEGSELLISSPRNFFPLNNKAKKHNFVGGGIGITPLMSMLREAQWRSDDFHLHYFVRSPERGAFIDQLRPVIEAGKASIYYDSEGTCPSLDLLFETVKSGEHIYYCGPAGFMDAMDRATAHWPAGTVQYERFNAPVADAATTGPTVNSSFQIQLARSGQTYTVGADETIVETLKRNGIVIDVSCTEGYCGTCMTRYLEGTPEHRDSVLDDAGRKNYLMACCARSEGETLVLDL